MKKAGSCLHLFQQGPAAGTVLQVFPVNLSPLARPQGVQADDPELLKIRKHVETTFEKFRQVEEALWKELTK